ncbi:Uncharacterised protein [Mycobacteroides abscessus subsp. abscessus]|nr:Uncharacterised protein [Mycobacteroides abscessus subsp. abscessus]
MLDLFGRERNDENRCRCRRSEVHRRRRGDRKVDDQCARHDQRRPVDTHEMPCVITPFDREVVFAYIPVIDDDVVVERRSHCQPRRLTERVHTRFDTHASGHGNSGCHGGSAFSMGERRSGAVTNTGRQPRDLRWGCRPVRPEWVVSGDWTTGRTPPRPDDLPIRRKRLRGDRRAHRGRRRYPNRCRTSRATRRVPTDRTRRRGRRRRSSRCRRCRHHRRR